MLPSVRSTLRRPSAPSARRVSSSCPVFTVSNGQLNLNGYRGTVSVYDASGKQVSADHLQAGLYILRATDGNQSFVQKVVVR